MTRKPRKTKKQLAAEQRDRYAAKELARQRGLTKPAKGTGL